MKNFLRLICLASAITLLLAGAGEVWAQKKPLQVVGGKVRVKFTTEMAATLKTMKVGRKNGYVQTGLPQFDALTQKHKATEMKRVFPYNPQKEETHRKHGLHLWYELSVPLNTDVEQASREYKRLSNIEHAEPILAKASIQPNQAKIISETAASAITGPVNDPLFYLQWHYENDGETNGGVLEGDVNLVEAWKIQAGNPKVIVSVHDLGIDVKHKDLAANVWVNTIEKNGVPGVDDDFNGYVDDINGYDFSGNSGKIPAGDHATHVAGTIAAVNNNGIGVCGIAGGDGVNSGVKVMSAKILDGEYDNIGASYVYAADNGSLISQNSWTYTTPGVYDQAVLDGIDYFIEEAGNFPNSLMKGGIVIFAAGNSNNDLDYFPEAYDRVMSVASLGRTNQKASYSNFGSRVDISAPGGDQTDNLEDGILSTLPNNQYGFFQGTSMACPHVSGIAALVISQYGGKGYTAQDLWTALVTGTHDINAFNPDYVNQLGIGYIDAAFALKKNEKKAPALVKDFIVADSTQDNLGVTWSVSSDPDDGTASKYEIIYAKDSLDVAKRINVKSIVVGSIGAAGDKMTSSIPNLYPTTKYFAAIYAIDRWGNRSGISAIDGSETTEGPSVSIDKSAIDFMIDVAIGKQALDGFKIMNSAEGELNWKSEVRQKDYTLDWSAVKYPIAKKAAAGIAHKTGAHPTNVNLKNRPKVVTTGYGDDYQQREINYVLDEYYGVYMIGETDTTISNSAATKFTVDYADGFNLTNIRTMVNNNSGGFREDPPFIVEVYRGEELDRKNLIYAAEYSGYSDYDVNYDLQLSQQLFLPAGSTFWIAVHMPAGHLYPLGMGQEAQENYSDNCFMSFDVGKTWTPLADAIGSPYYAWVQIPVSGNPGLDQYVTLSPIEGTVTGEGQQSVAVTADASKLINGDYHADVVVLNNDYSNSLATLPVSINVKGQRPNLTSDQIVNFGGVFVGRNKEITVTVKNIGLGNFTVSSASINNANFELVNSPDRIGALDKTDVTIKFTPQSAGAQNGVLTLSEGNGNDYVININGIGVAPSKINLTPATASYTMALGDTQTGKFTIKNTGTYPLQFFMPKYSSGEGIDYVNDGYNAYGYSYRTSTDGSGLVYSWDDISSTGVDVSEFFKDVINNKFYPVKIGFDFPIFNKVTDQLMITSYGILTIDDQVPLIGNSINLGDEYMPFGFISALNLSLSVGTGGKIYYQLKSGKLIVQYENVSYAWDDSQHITFQLVVNDNGSVQINYKDISLDSWNTSTIEVAIEDPDKKFGYLISNYDNQLNAASGFSVEIVSPGRDILKNLSATQGTIPIGGSMDIDYEVQTADLAEGNFYQNLVVVSNDPATPSKTFKANVNITSGGVVDVSLNSDNLDLGEVFIGDEVNTIIQVQNKGTKTTSVQSITSDHGYFVLGYGATPLVLKPKSSIYITVVKQGVTAGDFQDNVHIKLSTGTILDAVLHASVLTPPDIAITYDPIEDILESGESKTHTVTITNTGENELNVVPSGTSWVYTLDAAPGSAGIQYPKNTFYWSTNDTNSGITYAWEDVTKTGKRIDFLHNSLPEEKEIDLPFAFSFYGKEYTKLYINPNGLVYFTPEQQVYLFPSATIPAAEEPNNFIAPYWANGAYYTLNHAVYGVFYKITDDVVTIEYANSYNLFGMGDPWNFQVMLYKNGSIKFQYQVSGWSVTTYGVIGVENEDATEGVRVAAFQNFVHDGLAVVLTPANRLEIAAGETENITLNVDSRDLMAGSYSTDFQLQTNVPGKTSVLIPISLTVTGSPKLEAPDSLDMGDLIAKEKPNEEEPELVTYSKEFYLENSGAAMLDFTAIGLEDGSTFSLWMEVSSPFGKYWSEVPSELLPGDISLAPKGTQKFKIEVTPSLGNYILKDTLIVGSNDAVGETKIPVAANIMLPPVMNVDNDSFVFNASDKNFTGDDSFTIDNIGGESPLKYALAVKYQRTGIASTSAKSKKAKTGNIPTLETSKAKPATGITSVDGYNRTLEYSDADSPENFIGFGIGTTFVSVTKFTAPSDGFTLTHIQSYYNSNDLATSNFTVKVHVGASMEEATLLSSDEYELALGARYEGAVLFDLKTPQTFYPGETFFIEIDYPFGTGYPQGMVDIGKSLPGTFLYYIPDFNYWGDITEDPEFINTGWLVKGLEKEFVAGNWLALNSATTGSVAVDESASIDFSVAAKNVTGTDGFAEIVVTSNAPKNREKAVRVNLHMNQAPQFEEQDYEWYATEMDTSRFTVPVKDLEGDAITISIADAPNGFTWTKGETAILVTYVPDYLSARIKNITIQAKDAGNRTSTKSVTLNVMNVNRAPVVVSHADREYDYGTAAEEVETSTLVADPDTDDILNVVASSSDLDIVEVFASAEKIRIKPRKMGEAVITLTATDNFGASVSTTFNVAVNLITGIETPGFGTIKIYPNPTVQTLNVSWEDGGANVDQLYIMDAMGRAHQRIDLDHKNKSVQVDVTGLATGLYVLKIQNKDTHFTYKFIKK